MINEVDQLKAVEHLLPPQMQEIITVVGLTAALALVRTWGGTRFPVSKAQRDGGIGRYEHMAEVMGVTAADRLTEAYGGKVLHVPRCYVALLELRDNMIKAEFDQRYKNETTLSIAADLALRYRLTDRQIHRILKTMDRDPSDYEREYNDQFDLFEPRD